MTTITTERKLARCKIGLMRNKKFALMSGLLMVGTTSIVDGLPTARTNGRDEEYGRAFVDGMSEIEVSFVIMHECMHKMYQHLTTWRKLYDIDRDLANQACDYVINLELKELDPAEQFIAMPRDKAGKNVGLIDTKFRGMSTKQVWDILRKEQDEGKQGGEGKPGDGKGGKGDSLDDHDWEGADALGKEEKEALAKEIDQAIREGIANDKKMNGDKAGDLARRLGLLMEPKVNWREVLRDWVKNAARGRDTSTWRKPNRRFLHEDVIMPTMVSTKMGSIVVAVDTSGSIGDKEMADFLSEVKGIADEVAPERVELLYWDSRVAGHETYEGGAVEMITQSTKPRGGGGTSPSCVSTYLRDKAIVPECIVVLTDGVVGGDWGNEWTAPILWCIIDNTSAVPTHGLAVHITSEK